MRAYGMSRAELFAAVDAPALRPLPAEPYAFALWKRCRVAPDYHVEVDGNWYSVPYRLIRELVDVRIADRTVEAFYKGERVANCPRAGATMPRLPITCPAPIGGTPPGRRHGSAS